MKKHLVSVHFSLPILVMAQNSLPDGNFKSCSQDALVHFVCSGHYCFPETNYGNDPFM